MLCWGDDSLGQTGSAPPPHATGGYAPQPVPAPVEGLGAAVAIDCGQYHCCAALEDGTARCWGYAAWGQLGTAEIDAPLDHVATDVGLAGVIAIAADGYSSCALTDDGAVHCWGNASQGQIGIDVATADTCQVVVDQVCARTPRRVVAIERARSIALGGTFACAGTDEGLLCWGLDREGAVEGDGAGPREIDEIAAGVDHVCARSGATVLCRGRGTEGQLGDGRSASSPAFVRAAID